MREHIANIVTKMYMQMDDYEEIEILSSSFCANKIFIIIMNVVETLAL